MRLDKYLSQAGVGTRSEVKKLIKHNRIKVNGTVITDCGYGVIESADTVLFDDKTISYEEFVYYIFHKPGDCVCANEDRDNKTVFEYFKDVNIRDLFTVGRLDKDTEGLLIVTNDGDLSHRLLSPKKHVDKTYFLKCQEEVSDEDIKALENGVDIGDEKITLPAKASRGDEPNEIYLTIKEGRYHQVKRMLRAVGNEVIYLKRITMGKFELDDLPMGEYRLMNERELEYVAGYKGGNI
ncbi:MAG: rRNA pseudouridine synthase [Lachnospiraceae bacterium]|nr:rRNA pseudouridine synthase [Lachnospiraceae bacterium]